MITNNLAGNSGHNALEQDDVHVLIVDDHPIVCFGVTQLLSRNPKFKIVGSASSAQEALSFIKKEKVDLVIMDISLNGVNGLEAIKMLLAQNRRLAVLVQSMHSESVYALRALKAGARGYLMKQYSVQNLLEAAERVASGNIYVSEPVSHVLMHNAIRGEKAGTQSLVDALTDRELEVFMLIGEGHDRQQIVNMMGISMKTLETHKENIKKKLALKSSHDLLRTAIQWQRVAEIPEEVATPAEQVSAG